ncbi:PREDICTED: NADH dehydrogenase [ubiquinone] 1 alpha subcomplex subunit 10, mitochondrial [Cyphomyrmex costatus]|uniref:NADH dehydrogenase [ubiquinone] 1 alpha subcomplex subunit 10, mitochondrial n=1 Tax=Cyphomyrmex costatus TaxID=456900 RepID=A0A151IE18_9HYME|nr:PREDICTED: NADH dehydrogenase [ubiquinone] 1 alpha subcomplex subunit 10, mitochondrial [Cyphomyrmex costatus]KYM98921.1 NADH dehydrogenase [ubiquinone] 1 alpha subcomplex subunit 10, mitochondrial [Cyphomyrmex costatus]
MASLARVGFVKLGYNNLTRQLCKVTATSNVMQLAFIAQKAKRINCRHLAPFDYLHKKYGFWAQMFDPMVDRCDENSKVIVVEGPIAAGKSKVAAKLAEEFEMVYLPPPTFDEYYINEYGYDIRTLDDRLSVGSQSCDVQKFLTNPYHPNVPMFQFHYFQLKFDQYITTLLHLLSTGQGVVLNRSFYSDYVFAKAMTNAGYMRSEALTFYHEIVDMAKLQMLRPHLIIYLDVPVNTVMEKIKKRSIPYEVNSKVLTSEYLQDIENIYKLDYLRSIEEHSHVLIYDWTNEGDITYMVEDIETLNFDYEDKTAKKMSDWRFESVQDLRTKRQYYENRYHLHIDYWRNKYSIPELHYTAEEKKEMYEIMQTVPGYKYTKGYNTNLGDKNILWKKDPPFYLSTLRPSAREVDVLVNEMEKLKAAATV